MRKSFQQGADCVARGDRMQWSLRPITSPGALIEGYDLADGLTSIETIESFVDLIER